LTSRGIILKSAILVLIAFGLMILAPTHDVQKAQAAPSYWITWANNAWRYFQPDIGVIRSTGLSTAGLGYPYFTEWDLGTYIFAILDAEKIGILPRTGDWGSTYRLDKVMNFLSTRTLTSYSTSYLWYSSNTGAPQGSDETNVSDLGFLLIALETLRTYRPEYASAINGVIARENITRFASSSELWGITSGLYKWYVAHGFKFFGFDTYAPVQEALNTLQTILSGPQLQTYGVTLPVTWLTSEPLLLAAFTISPEPGFANLVLNSYQAQQNRYVATAKFTAFSEGNTGNPTPPGYPSYIYEWIVTGGGQTWTITPWEVTPIIYIKVGFGFYGLLGTQYALNLINYVNAFFTDWSSGYWDGVDENGRVVNNVIDRTQGIILAAARYALEKKTSSISLGVSAGSIALGASVTLSGTLTPTEPFPGIPVGALVSLSCSFDGTSWMTFITTKTGSGGAYSIAWYPPYPGTYQLKASWSGDSNYEGCTSSTGSLTVTGTFPPRIAILVLGPASAVVGGSVTFDVIVTNPGSAISTTLYFEVFGPGGYWYFDTQKVSLTTGERGRFQFVWKIPLTAGAGQYRVFVGLIPPKPTAIAQTQITVL